jgi:ABC-type protease/lipase transport system fused ATPase/permease subunit
MSALLHARAKGITTVVIAHRPRVLAQVDKLLVLRDGRVERFGDRQEVLHRLLPAPNVVASLRQAAS